MREMKEMTFPALGKWGNCADDFPALGMQWDWIMRYSVDGAFFFLFFFCCCCFFLFFFFFQFLVAI